MIKLIMLLIILIPGIASAMSMSQVESQLGFRQSLCNTCVSYMDFEQAAMNNAKQNGKLVVSNMVTGEQAAFQFISEVEPGYLLIYVQEIPIPAVAITALSQYKATVSSLVSAAGGGGGYLDFKAPNIPIIIPTSMASGASAALQDLVIMAKISNHLRLALIGDLGSLTSLAKAVLATLNKGTVTVRFQNDGSTMSFILGYVFDGYMPYKYIEGTAKDASGAPIGYSGTTGGGADGGSFNHGGGTFMGTTGSCETWSFPNGSGGTYTLQLNCMFFLTP